MKEHKNQHKKQHKKDTERIQILQILLTFTFLSNLQDFADLRANNM